MSWVWRECDDEWCVSVGDEWCVSVMMSWV